MTAPAAVLHCESKKGLSIISTMHLHSHNHNLSLSFPIAFKPTLDLALLDQNALDVTTDLDNSLALEI